MKISNDGIALIKRFEGLRLTAYKCAAGVWTIGYGHTAGVKRGQKITQAQADAFLRQDVAFAEKAVNECKYISWQLTEPQFDALVSFTFNCGVGCLKTLVKGRPAYVVADKILLYNKAGGVKNNGLVDRRNAERTMFLYGVEHKKMCPYAEPTKTVTSIEQAKLRNCASCVFRGDSVRWLQWMLNATGKYALLVDGVCGKLTVAAISDFQKRQKLTVDGLAGKKTREALKKAV